MRSRVFSSRSFFLLIVLLIIQLKAYAAAIDDWQKFILDGSSYKFDGKYNLAIESFKKALELAKNQKFPPKCLPISLCRLADVEVITNKIDEAEAHSQKIVEILKQQKDAGILDPQVNFWAAVLSDSYLDNTRPATREKCLKRACYLKNLIYGGTHDQSIGSLSTLACYYIDQSEIEKAIHILSLSQDILEKKYGKNPDGLGESINQLALKYRKEGKYDQSNRLELFVIDRAKRSIACLHNGLPAFYSLLGMNALVSGADAEYKEYFRRALAACSALKNKRERKQSEQYIDILTLPSFSDVQRQKAGIAERELRHILEMEQMIGAENKTLYKTYPLLAAAIISKKGANFDEYEKYMNNAITIAKLPNSEFKKDIPDLYMRLGLTDGSPNRMAKSNIAFSKALEAETDKHGFHATLVLFWWAWELSNEGDEPLQKLEIALKQAHALALANLGTLLADLLKLKADIVRARSNADLASSLEQQSIAEIKLQKKLNSKLGPDFYHRM